MARPNKAKLELAQHWKTQIRQVEEEYNRWHKRCERISQRYRDERKTIDDERKNLNLFWSNVEILKPAIYSKTPTPICERRFLDKDTTGRVAATILERALRYEVSMAGFDSAARRCRDDYLIVGRGQAWVRYNPEFGEPISPESTGNDEIIEEGSGAELEGSREDEEDQVEREIVRESLDISYVHWQDYYQLPARVRTEEEIEGKARRLFMSRDDLKERFGAKGKKVPLDHVPKPIPDEGSAGLVQGKDGMQATVYEIWWKPTRKVYFIAKEYDDILEEADDPLNLEGFFPCPPALHATVTNDTMIPVPDYVESQDQYAQIDNLTKRIDVLTSALQVRGVYDASAQGVKRIFEEGKEPDLIPVDSWAMFAEKGGLKGVIDFIPLEEIGKTLQILIEVRAKVIEDLDRTTGIWDIMRGTSDARETMGAQRLKQNNGSGRLQARQDDMARFCRDIISIMGEIISEHFDPKTLIQVSGALYDEGLEPPDLKPQIANQFPPPMMGHNGGPPMPMPGAPLPPQTPPMGAPQSPSGAPSGPSPMQPQQNGMPAPPSIVQGPESPEAKQLRKLQMIAEALQLLRDDKLRGFRIDIETDSTVQGDAAEEKAARIAFVEGVTKFIEVGAQVTMQVPEFAPLAAKMLQFAVRGFRVGRDLESAIEDFCEKAEQDAKAQAANPQQKVDPKVQAEQIKAATAKMQAEAEVRAQQVEAASEAQNKQLEMRLKAMDIQIEQLKAMAEVKATQIKAQADEREHAMGNIEAARDLHIGAVEHEQHKELLEAQHKAKMKQTKEPKQ